MKIAIRAGATTLATGFLMAVSTQFAHAAPLNELDVSVHHWHEDGDVRVTVQNNSQSKLSCRVEILPPDAIELLEEYRRVKYDEDIFKLSEPPRGDNPYEQTPEYEVWHSEYDRKSRYSSYIWSSLLTPYKYEGTTRAATVEPGQTAELTDYGYYKTISEETYSGLLSCAEVDAPLLIEEGGNYSQTYRTFVVENDASQEDSTTPSAVGSLGSIGLSGLLHR